jgi:hypothetical protein
MLPEDLSLLDEVRKVLRLFFLEACVAMPWLFFLLVLLSLLAMRLYF